MHYTNYLWKLQLLHVCLKSGAQDTTGDECVILRQQNLDITDIPVQPRHLRGAIHQTRMYWYVLGSCKEATKWRAHQSGNSYVAFLSGHAQSRSPIPVDEL